jgi:ABC-type multidrug transport system ATPase subunit
VTIIVVENLTKSFRDLRRGLVPSVNCLSFTARTGLEGDGLRRRMEEVFATLHMNDFRDVLGAKMNTGMRQKVSIARAVIHDPPVLIFDEPTAGLDVLVARSVM